MSANRKDRASSKRPAKPSAPAENPSRVNRGTQPNVQAARPPARGRTDDEVTPEDQAFLAYIAKLIVRLAVEEARRAA